MNTANTNTNNTKNEIAIKWSPFKDEDFILVSSNILLYSIYNYDRSTKTRNDTNLYLSESSFAELVASVNTYLGQKLVSWYPGFDAGLYTLALHETNTTHIKVLSLFNQNDNITNSATLDIENQRKSNFVEWNPIKCNFLGLGFEKLNDNSSVCIWDAFFSTKPYLKLDECETCYSFAWHPENPDLLFTSGNYDCVSLFDIRAGTKPVESVNTEFVHGFSIDPKNSYHAASYDNNKLVIWDLRKFRDLRKPVALIEESKPIKRFQFCPAKEDRLAVLTENSQCVNIYRLEERDENILKHNVQYTSKHPKHPVLSSFSWHSKDFNRMMVSAYGSFNMNLFYDFLVTDFCLLGFSETTNLNVLCNDWDFSVRDVTKAYDELKSDIGERMKQRALNAYGVGDFLKNINLLSSDGSENDVKYLWYWLDLSNRINERPVGNMEKYFGVRTILSELSKSYPDPAAQNFNVKAYIQKVCGWCDWTELVNRLEANGEFERAACVCVFNNGVDRAIQILKNSSKSSNLNENLALSLALSCMHRSNTTESNKILTRLSNPYLKALFSYLIDSENFDYQILNDSQIFLPDKICMAMSFLKLEQLTSYIMRDLTPEFIKQGNLYGILLTGLGPECIELFQSYLHRTGDVQTPAVAVIHSTVAKIQNSKLVNGWIESYRELLDSWMLWTQRAEYDIKRSKPVEPKISIRCGHCGDNLSSKKKSRGIELLGANIAMACQACHQPLLRCSVCSLYMTLDPPKSAFDGKKDKMFYWFVFCQKCTHGGHLGHLKNWFSTNPECPVMACNCQCNLVK